MTGTAGTDGSTALRVYLLDDHVVVRRGLRAVLEAEDGIAIVGESGTVAEAVPQIRELVPDVAVLDGRLPDGSGIDVCREVRSAEPRVQALILACDDDEDAMVDSVLAGASGYVLKTADERELVDAVRAVGHGQSLVGSDVALRVVERMGARNQAPGLSRLTDGEWRVLDLIAEGMTNRQIGERLHLAEKTVKNQITGLLAKLGVQRRTQAAVLASALGRRRPR
ncbi:response regulator transcription factor [Nocardioides sp. zg-1228]|uniref:response regulator n=1 Tax=Nocardioides sp. zg-1228 TaxID=2763008 RepID=UPI001642D6A8|nr:response regulator transcription factor [Nocardioides sp. zg-1228]MBC2932310.1 response regulator transcription factor [Nocardioides sp. zg-1228]QSF57829.1 response regulator transcription factor [Nocardioides sp. zg-1228]